MDRPSRSLDPFVRRKVEDDEEVEELNMPRPKSLDRRGLQRKQGAVPSDTSSEQGVPSEAKRVNEATKQSINSNIDSETKETKEMREKDETDKEFRKAMGNVTTSEVEKIQERIRNDPSSSISNDANSLTSGKGEAGIANDPAILAMSLPHLPSQHTHPRAHTHPEANPHPDAQGTTRSPLTASSAPPTFTSQASSADSRESEMIESLRQLADANRRRDEEDSEVLMNLKRVTGPMHILSPEELARTGNIVPTPVLVSQNSSYLSSGAASASPLDQEASRHLRPNVERGLSGFVNLPRDPTPTQESDANAQAPPNNVRDEADEYYDNNEEANDEEADMAPEMMAQLMAITGLSESQIRHLRDLGAGGVSPVQNTTPPVHRDRIEIQRQKALNQEEEEQMKADFSQAIESHGDTEADYYPRRTSAGYQRLPDFTDPEEQSTIYLDPEILGVLQRSGSSLSPEQISALRYDPSFNPYAAAAMAAAGRYTMPPGSKVMMRGSDGQVVELSDAEVIAGLEEMHRIQDQENAELEEFMDAAAKGELQNYEGQFPRNSDMGIELDLDSDSGEGLLEALHALGLSTGINVSRLSQSNKLKPQIPELLSILTPYAASLDVHAQNGIGADMARLMAKEGLNTRDREILNVLYMLEAAAETEAEAEVEAQIEAQSQEERAALFYERAILQALGAAEFDELKRNSMDPLSSLQGIERPSSPSSGDPRSMESIDELARYTRGIEAQLAQEQLDRSFETQLLKSEILHLRHDVSALQRSSSSPTREAQREMDTDTDRKSKSKSENGQGMMTAEGIEMIIRELKDRVRGEDLLILVRELSGLSPSPTT